MPAPGIVAKPWVSIPTTWPITLSRVNQMLVSARRLCAISPFAHPLVFDSNKLPYVYQFPVGCTKISIPDNLRDLKSNLRGVIDMRLRLAIFSFVAALVIPASRRSISACTDQLTRDLARFCTTGVLQYSFRRNAGVPYRLASRRPRRVRAVF
jgi:hypothetical protein